MTVPGLPSNGFSPARVVKASLSSAVTISIGMVCVPLAVGAGLVTHPKYAAVLVAAPILALIVSRPGTGFLLAATVALLVPKTVPDISSATFVLLLCGGSSLRRWKAVDVFFAAWLGWTLLGWWVHGETVSARHLLTWAICASFYLFARWTPASLDKMRWLLLAIGTFGALTVLYEWRTHHLLFASAIDYQWAYGTVFRAGSIFGGAPSTSIVLAMIFLSSLPLHKAHPKLITLCLALIAMATVVTYSRAGWLGAVAGLLLYLWMTPGRRRNVRIACLAAIGVVALAAFWGTVSQTTTFQQGVVRSQNTSIRKEFFHESLPVAADTTGHLLAGRGFDALVNPAKPDARLAQIPDVLSRGGAHDTYLTVLLEQGLIGLLLLCGWLVPAIRAGIQRKHAAALTAALTAFAVAGLFHDLTHGNLVLMVGCLIAGLQMNALQEPSPV